MHHRYIYLKSFDKYSIPHLYRELNMDCDRLTNAARDKVISEELENSQGVAKI